MKREGDYMANVQAVIDLPEQLYLSLSASGLTKEKIASESRKLLALKCFRERLLSLGRSAELSGLSKRDFIEFLSDNNVPVLDHEEEELEIFKPDAPAYVYREYKRGVTTRF